MICCKIIADFGNKDASFSKLCDLLEKKGSWMWSSGVMLFADTSGDTEEKDVIRYIKKAGYTKYFIDCYDKDNEPHETEEINGWVSGKVAKIIAVTFYKDQQEVIKTSKAYLDQLNQELDQMLDEAIKAKREQEAATAANKVEDKK